MKELIRYEIKKIISPVKFIIILMASIMLCCVIFIFSKYQADYEYVKEMQSAFQGRVTEGNVAESVQRYEELIDKKNTDELSGEEESEFYSIETPVWLSRCDEVRKEILAGLGIQAETLSIGDTISYGFMENFISRYLPMILCFLISFLTGSVFSNEYESKMDGIILASKEGKRELILAKFIASMSITAILHVMILSIYMLFVVLEYGFSEPDVSFVFTAGDPYNYLSSPFDFEVWQYIIVLVGVSLLGSIGYCIFTLFVSSKCNRSVISTAISMTVGFLPYLMYVTIADEQSKITNLLRFFYSQMISVRTLFAAYNTIRLGSIEIQTLYLSLVCMIIVTVIMSRITYCTFQKHQAAN